MQPKAWGYRKSADGEHLTAAEVLKKLNAARAQDANLLLNIGPLTEGSLPDSDSTALLEVGRVLAGTR